MINCKVEQYMQDVCSHIKYKKAHSEIRLELLNHIEEKTEEFIALGMKEQEAYSKAVLEMGEAESIGRELNKYHRAAPEWGILIMTVLFTLIGLLSTFLIATNGIENNSNEGYLIKTIFFTSISYIALGALYFFDYKLLERQAIKIFIGTTLLLAAQFFIGETMHGVRNWLYLGPFSIDIAEISLFLYAISTHKVLKEFREKEVKGYLIIAASLFIPSWIYIQLKVPMEVLIFFSMFFFMMVVIKLKPLFIGAVIGIFSVAALEFIISNAYRIKRFSIFINFKEDRYMYNPINTLLKHSGLLGNGFTFPKTAVPSVESEYILIYIIYTFGLIAGLILVALISSFIARIFLASRAVKNNYGRLIIQNFMFIFSIEFAWNILSIVGLAPMMGVCLPFISYGSSRLMVQMLAIGLMMSIYRSKSITYVEE